MYDTEYPLAAQSFDVDGFVFRQASSGMMVSSLSGDQRRARGLGRRGATEPWGRRPPKSRPGVPASPSGSSEEGDSDSKSTVSSSPSN